MPKQKKIIIVHNVAHACKALELAKSLDQEIVIASPPNASIYMGFGHFRQICNQAAKSNPDAKYKCIIDCGNSYAMSMAAMQKGYRYVSVNADEQSMKNLRDIANNYNAEIMTSAFYSPKSLRKRRDDRNIDTLDLIECDNMESAITDFLS